MGLHDSLAFDLPCFMPQEFDRLLFLVSVPLLAML
jgi:hypothetical protein